MLLGSQAPAFSLSNQFGESVSREDLAGRPALLVFFPLVFTPVCEGELGALVARHEQFTALGASVLGISVDHRYALRDAADRLGVGFDLLSDFWPHGQTARAYGSFDPVRGHATRHTFLLDAAGTVVREFSSAHGEARDADAYVDAVASLGSRR